MHGLPLVLAIALAAAAPARAAEPIIRVLEVTVDVQARQHWESHTEEYGDEYYDARTTQHYELRVSLRSDTGLHTRNILNPDLDKRLRAKTIHLARQAMKEIKASGGEITIPRTPEQRSRMSLEMQEALTACGADAVCRNDVNQRYAALFAVAENPDVLDPSKDTGERRYRYFEPYRGCSHRARVAMTFTMQGRRYSEEQEAVVPFTEKRTAERLNPPHDLPLCQRYLAVIDTRDEAQPMYLENFYVPPAPGETVYTVAGNTRRTIDDQPLVPGALAWVSQQLRHADTAGTISGEFPLKFALNGRSEERGASSGTARITVTWSFQHPGTAR